MTSVGKCGQDHGTGVGLGLGAARGTARCLYRQRLAQQLRAERPASAPAHQTCRLRPRAYLNQLNNDNCAICMYEACAACRPASC